MFPEYSFGHYAAGVQYSNVEEYTCSCDVISYPIWVDDFTKTVYGDYYAPTDIKHTLLGKSHNTCSFVNILEILGLGFYSATEAQTGRWDLIAHSVKELKNTPQRRKRPLLLLQDVIDKSLEELQLIVNKGIYNVHD